MFNFYNAIMLITSIASALLVLYVITLYFKKNQAKLYKEFEDFVVSEWIVKAIELLDRVKPEDYFYDKRDKREKIKNEGILVNATGNVYRLLFKDFGINVQPDHSGFVSVEVYDRHTGNYIEMKTLDINSKIELERDYANSAMRVINMAQDINVKELEAEKVEFKQKFLSL